MTALANETTLGKTRPSTQGMKITKIKEHVGAEVTGIDLREDLDAETQKRLNDAVVEHVALVIRDQTLEPEQFQTAIGRFGELMPDQAGRYFVEGLPMVNVLSNRHKDSKGTPAKVERNSSWHTDHTNQEIPPKYTTLYAVSLPDKGGITSVSNMRAAYESLSDDLRKRIDSMQTANTLISSTRFDTGNPDIINDLKTSGVPPTMHPLVRTHPESGTKAIWFHKGKTETVTGLDPYETQDFLAELLVAALKPEFVYAHEWKPGDVLLIDNRGGMHRAGVDYDHRQHRMLYRCLVRGDRPH
jgi:taurine dioxygenase